MASRPQPHEDTPASAPLGGTRAEAVQRLQVGLSLLGGVILLVGLAHAIEDRAKMTEAASVPEAAATVTATPSPPAQSDPLADAGVVPDLPAEPAASSTPPLQRPVLPETGNATSPQ
jgi:hypothetical protein